MVLRARAVRTRRPAFRCPARVDDAGLRPAARTGSAKVPPTHVAGMLAQLGIRPAHVVIALVLSVFAVPTALARESLAVGAVTWLFAFGASFLFVWGMARIADLF